MPKIAGRRYNIFANNVLHVPNNVAPVIGKAIVRIDYDADGQNKNSAKMNLNELTYFAAFKSYYENLNAGKPVLIQTTCLSDKHTHWLIEMYVHQMFLHDSNTKLSEVLKNAAHGNKEIRDFANSQLMKEIKWRRGQEARTAIVNVLNRYELAMFGEIITNFEDDFNTIKSNIDRLHARFKGLTVNEIFGKVDAYPEKISKFNEADLITLGDNVFLNETLVNNFLTYCDNTNDDRWNARIADAMMLHAKDLWKSHFRLDTTLDPSLFGIVNALQKTMGDEFKHWYDENTGVLKAFRIFDKTTNEEVFPTHGKSSIEKYFDSNNYYVELNPVLNSHYFADIFLSEQFNTIVFGQDWGLENRYLRDINKEIKKRKNAIDANYAKIQQLESQNTPLTGEDFQTWKRNIENAEKAIIDLQKEIDELSNPYNEDFLRKSEASRLSMHYKRTVHGGATFVPLHQNMKYGVPPKVKTAVFSDKSVNLFAISGNIDKFKSQDGAGHSSPYFSRMCNNSYVDGRVGENKKTIFSYTDPETGILHLIKWAEYEITNSIRRNSPVDFEHASWEVMFKKMHNMFINGKYFANFDISDYYNTDKRSNITHNKELFYYKDGQHYKILSVSNIGNQFYRRVAKCDINGNIDESTIQTEPPYIINSIYDLDQFFGGAYVEEQQDDGRLDFTEVQNDIITNIICDLGLKEHFIGFAVNASAIKSGMENVNAYETLIGNNRTPLQYFEMSTRQGGAQMNPDHIIDETEVTEMSQMISALIQAGLKARQVDKIYKFIGMVAKESLGDLVDWVDDPDKEEDVYKWLGEAVIRSFQSGSTDTLGLAGAFIGRANRKAKQFGLKTKIPFSANTVKGVFEAAISSYINREAIHRKFPGGGFVQMPTFDEKLVYSIGSKTVSFEDIQEYIRHEIIKRRSNITIQDALSDYTTLEITSEGRLWFKNPFIEPVNPENVSSLVEGDTVVLYDTDDITGNVIESSIELMSLDEFWQYDYVRNLTPKNVAKWTVRPKNLLGPRTTFKVTRSINGITTTTEHSIYDLDSARALLYTKMWLNGDRLSTPITSFLQDYASKQDITFDLSRNSEVERLNKWAAAKLKQDLRELSRIKEVGSDTFNVQSAFITNDNNVIISDVNFAGSQVLMGISEAEAFGIHNREDLQKIQENPLTFFKNQLGYLRNRPSNEDVNKSLYDGVLHSTGGETMLLIVDELHGNDKSYLDGTSYNGDYVIGLDEHTYYQDEDLGYLHGIEFLTRTGTSGQQYTVVHAQTMEDFNNFYNSTNLYSNWLPNANDDNLHKFVKYIPNVFEVDGNIFITRLNGRVQSVRNAELLNGFVSLDYSNKIDQLAAKKVASWNAYHKGIGTRIPAQSMQSFTPCEIVGFTPYKTTGIHIGAKLMWIQGSDLDIDKLYYMTYGFTDDGMLATFSDLDTILDAEKVLDLPKPAKRNFNVTVINSIEEVEQAVKDNNAVFIRGKDIKLLNDILSQDNNNIVVLNEDLQGWTNLYNPKQKVNLKELLDLHENSKRSSKVRQLALRNTVVRGILNVLSDPIVQYNLELPISMDDAKNAARDSDAGNEELYLTADNPTAKYKMQIQNMVGRDVIGIGASSLKAFFGATTYFNVQVDAIEDSIVNGTFNGSDAWDRIKSVAFNSKFSDRGLITLANVDYYELQQLLLQNPQYQIITISGKQASDTMEDVLGLVKDVNDRLYDSRWITENINFDGSRVYTINLLNLVNYLNDAANGTWDNPIDAAFNLSELISAATDNAKELILSKINATTKFADIYTYLLSVGESFSTIAKFMTSPLFNIIADYSEGNVLNVNTRYFDLEKAIKFVSNEETLPIIDNNIWNNILTSYSVDTPKWGFIGSILYDSSHPELFIKEFNEFFKYNNLNGLEILIKLNDQYSDKKSDSYKSFVSFMYTMLSKYDWVRDTLSTFLLSQKAMARASSEVITTGYEGYDFDYDYDEAIEEEEMAHSYDTKLSELTTDDWTSYYKYLHEWFIPMNEARSDISKDDFDNLELLSSRILPALKEQRILAKILGINQGLRTQDFEEYKWIRDIEAFVNERYIDAVNSNSKYEFEEFNLIKFLSDDVYRDKQIKMYEQVKSTYNILDIITKTPQFWEMFKLSGTNRKLIEKAVILKYERIVANTLLKVNKPLAGSFNTGIIQKLNDREFRVIQQAVSDIITRNWFTTLDGLMLPIPQNKNIQSYKNGILNKASELEIGINTADGLATFKWIVENYVLPELKKLDKYKPNSFIQDLQGTYTKNIFGNDVIEYITLPVGLVNSTSNSELEKVVTQYRSDFNSIYKDELDVIGLAGWTIGDLFYLYNLYTFKDGFGRDSLTRIFEDMISIDDRSSLANDYYNYLCRLDSGVQGVDAIQELLNISDEQLSEFDKSFTSDMDIHKLISDLRMLFGELPSASTKFRVRNKKDEYELLDKDYKSSDPLTVPKSKFSRSDYKFILPSWNPKVIVGPQSEFMRRRSSQKRSFKINGTDAIRVIVEQMQQTFGDKIPINLITTEFLNSEAGKHWKVDSNATAFIRNGQIYIIENAEGITASEPIHELMHVVCAALKFGNSSQRNLYYGLLRAVQDKRASGNPFWNEYFENIEDIYKDENGNYTVVGSDLQEEVLIAALSDAFNSKYYGALKTNNRNLGEESEIGGLTFREFEDRIKLAIEQVFGMEETKISAQRLMDFTLGDLLFNFSSSLFDFNGDVLSSFNIPLSQKLARFKRKLASNSKDKDNSYLTIEGDC